MKPAGAGGHAGVEVLDGGAGRLLAHARHDGVNGAGHGRLGQGAGEARRHAHVFEVALPDGGRMLGEVASHVHAVTVRRLSCRVLAL